MSTHRMSNTAIRRVLVKVITDSFTLEHLEFSRIIGAPEPTATPEPEVAVVTEETVSTEAEAPGRTYTVQSGDSLWKISEKMYGSGNKYMKIFEANTSLLENPDKIFPGQELVIPDLDE